MAENVQLFEGNWAKRFIFVHLNKILNIGGKRPYQVEDLFEISGKLTTMAFNDVRPYFEDSVKNTKNLI